MPAVLFLPALQGWKHSFFLWLLYGIYLLVVLFVWGIGGKRNRNVSRGFDPEQNNAELNHTEELLRERSLWSLFRF